jgi:hypothetical protein
MNAMTFLRVAALSLSLLILSIDGSAQQWPEQPRWRWTPPAELTSPLLEPSASATNVSATSTDGETLVAWESWGRIAAARYAPDGTRLDETPIVLGATAERDATRNVFQQTPRVATNGERYLVVWRYGAQVEGQFVTRDGRLAGGVMIFPGLASNDSHFVASNGDSFAVSTRLVLTIVAPDGLMTPASRWVEGSPAIASDGEDYLVATHIASSGVSYALRFSPFGAFKGLTQHPVAWDALAWTGSEYLAFSSTQRALQRLDRDGNRIGEAIPLVTEQEPLRAVLLPRGPGSTLIVLAGRAGGVSWQMRLARLDGDDLTIGGFLPPLTGYPVALASSGGEVFAFWEAMYPDALFFRAFGVRHAEVDEAALAIDPPLGVSSALSAPDQSQLRSIATAGEFVSAWIESTEDATRLRAAIVTASGEAGAPFTVAHEVSSLSTPALASSGSIIMAAWYDYGERRGVWVRRFDALGTPLEEPRRIATTFRDSNSDRPAPALTWNGESLVLAWPAQDGIVLARIAESGTVLDPAGVLIPSRIAESKPSSLPALASTGGVTLLVWQGGTIEECRLSSCYVPPAVFSGIRLDRNLGFLDPAPFDVVPGRQAGYPRVVANDGVFLVTGGTLRERSIAVRINAAGEILDSPPLESLFDFEGGSEWRAIEDAEGIDAASVPGGFLMAAATAGSRCCGAALADEHLRLVFVPLAGAPSAPMKISGAWRSFALPQLAALPDGTTMLAYTVWREHAGVARRATIQMLRPSTPTRHRMIRR